MEIAETGVKVMTSSKEKKTFHPFLPNLSESMSDMLQDLGLKSLEELFSDLDPSFFVTTRLQLPSPHSELETRRHLVTILSKNRSLESLKGSFLGAGLYRHYVPASVNALASRAEFYTSYTPYAPELQQGMLQAQFEYESLMADLLEMDVVNASMYDWATAAAEALLTAVRYFRSKKTEVIVAGYVGPDRLKVMKTYLTGLDITLTPVKASPTTGVVNPETLLEALQSTTAAVYVENPNFLGVIEENLNELIEVVHDNGSLVILGMDPTTLGHLKSPGALDADIAVGEGQFLGTPLNFGGPSLGIFAIKRDRKLLHSMPGRLIGLTTEKVGDGRPAFCMTLNAREQHIKRAKATSNICTNEALMAIRAGMYLAMLGPQGLRELGSHCLAKSHYLATKLNALEGVRAPRFEGKFFKEFVMQLQVPETKARSLNKYLLEHHDIQGGYYLGTEFPELADSYLIATTEMNTKDQLDSFVAAVHEFLSQT